MIAISGGRKCLVCSSSLCRRRYLLDAAGLSEAGKLGKGMLRLYVPRMYFKNPLVVGAFGTNVPDWDTFGDPGSARRCGLRRAPACAAQASEIVGFFFFFLQSILEATARSAIRL